MKSAGEPLVLRPLSLGEVFDRAITLYVRNFVLFTAITLVVTAPLAILQYFAGLHQSDDFAQLIQQIQHPAHTSAPATTMQSGWTILLVIGGLVLNAFAIVAIADALGRLYRGEPADWQSSYAQALRHAVSVIVTLLGELAAFGTVIFAGAFAMVAVLVVALLLMRGSAVLGILGIAVAVIVTIAWFIGIILCYLVFAFAFNAIGVEGASSGRAIGSGFARIFNRSELLRAVLISLALTVIYFGLSIVMISVAALLETMRLHAVSLIVNSILSMIVTAALAVLMGIYYFDVRVRREGLDMQAQIEGLQTSAAAP